MKKEANSVKQPSLEENAFRKPSFSKRQTIVSSEDTISLENFDYFKNQRSQNGVESFNAVSDTLDKTLFYAEENSDAPFTILSNVRILLTEFVIFKLFGV